MALCNFRSLAENPQKVTERQEIVAKLKMLTLEFAAANIAQIRQDNEH